MTSSETSDVHLYSYTYYKPLQAFDQSLQFPNTTQI